MKYIVTESQYKKLNEEVGVPTNIVEIAQKLFDKIMSKLKPNVNLGMFLHKPITLKGDFQINDYKFNTLLYIKIFIIYRLGHFIYYIFSIISTFPIACTYMPITMFIPFCFWYIYIWKEFF